MRIVSGLQGGLERRQSIFIPETFVKVIPLQSTGFIFIMLRAVILSAKSRSSDRSGCKFNSRSHSGILLHVWNFVKNKFSSKNVQVFRGLEKKPSESQGGMRLGHEVLYLFKVHQVSWKQSNGGETQAKDCLSSENVISLVLSIFNKLLFTHFQKIDVFEDMYRFI